jgi:hypothetical protein
MPALRALRIVIDRASRLPGVAALAPFLPFMLLHLDLQASRMGPTTYVEGPSLVREAMKLAAAGRPTSPKGGSPNVARWKP